MITRCGVGHCFDDQIPVLFISDVPAHNVNMMQYTFRLQWAVTVDGATAL